MKNKLLALFITISASFTFAQTYEDSSFGIFGAYATEYNWFQNQMGFTDSDYWNWTDNHFQNLGAHWTRSNTQLIWDLIEPNLDGVYNWNIITNPDSVITNVYNSPANVNWLGCIHVMDNSSRNPLNYPIKWQNFLQALVERYNGDGTNDLNGFVNVKYWQIGNEIIGLSDSLSSVEYAQIVALSESAIHSVDSTAKICLVAPTQAFSPDTFLANTITQLFNMGVPFDIIDIHHWGNSFNYKMTVLPLYRTFLNNNGYSNVEIWSCENGTHCYQPDSVPYQTKTEQASSLVKRYVWNLNNGLDKLFWNNLMEWHGFAGDISNKYNSMGLIGDGSFCGEPTSEFNYLRKSYYSYKKLAENIDVDKATFINNSSFHNELSGNYGYVYQDLNTSENFEIFWTDNDSITYAITIASNYELTNMVPSDTLGNFATQTLSAGIHNITIYKDEVLLLKKAPTGLFISENNILEEFRIQIYPNPSKQTKTVIKYYLHERTNVAVKIYDCYGSEIITLVNNEEENAGEKFLVWNTQNMKAGIYFIRISIDKKIYIKKHILIE